MEEILKKEPTRWLRDVLVSTGAWIRGYSLFIPVGIAILLLSRRMPPQRFFPMVQWSCRLILRTMGIRVTVEGRQAVPRNRACLFMCNHVNLFDVFVLAAYMPGHFRGVELDEHFDWFFYGPIIRALGMIPISQTNGRSALKSLAAAREVIDQGTSVVILPEGGRTPDGRFQPFKRGAFLLAKRAGVPVVPMAMAGAYEINRRGSLIVRPGRMVLRFGQPIDCLEIARQKTDTVQRRIRSHMLALFNGQAV